MEFIKDPQLLEINGGWCIGINNEKCEHECSCEGIDDVCVGTDVDGCYIDNC